MTSPEDAFVLPVGTVTFLLTDVAGSTRLWETEPDPTMRAAIVRHYEILAAAVDRHGGVRPQEQGEGDSTVAAFARPSDALAAACDAQTALTAEPWPTSEPLRVRMALHTGEARLRDEGNYAGQAIIRTARLRNTGHGGQVLVSGATRDLAVDQDGDRFRLRSLGEHRLRDLGRPEHVWQLTVPGCVDDFDDLVTIDSVPNSLPVSLSPFIGRSVEIAALAELVQAERLVTITGTGGAGKTRIAQQVGAELVDRFPAGVWWVELASLDDDGVEAALRTGFGIGEGGATPFAEAVRRQIADRPCLVIVDNCEHVAGTAGTLVAQLLSEAPTLQVLATSRVMLDLPGEAAWRVPPLTLPERSVALDVEALAHYDAVSLFCDRAKRARPNFELTTTNGPAVAEICHRLAGLPLAIELAAARCRMLDPHRILSGLDDAFRILAGGSKAVMARQQTLDASITWSYDLLTSTEQTLLRRLSVFVDGWTLDDAEAICPDPDDAASTLDALDVFDALDRLVDHSLVTTVDTPDGLRFGLLETIRQYGLRQMSAEELDALRGRHSHHFTDWLESNEVDLVAPTDELLDRLLNDQANVLAATATAITMGSPSRALRALLAASPVFQVLGWSAPAAQIHSQLDQLLGTVPPDEEWMVHQVRQKALTLTGNFLAEIQAFQESQLSARAVGAEFGEALARAEMLIVFSLSDASLIDEVLDIANGIVDVHPRWSERLTLTVGINAALLGRLDLIDRTVASIEARHHPPLVQGMTSGVKGARAYLAGDPTAACRLLDAALAERHQIRSVALMFELLRALAGAELGRDLTTELEPRLRVRCDVDGYMIDGVAADLLAGVGALLADDLAGARAAIQRCVTGARSVGFVGYAEREQFTLVAAGYDEFLTPLAQVALRGPTAHAVNLAAHAEHMLRNGDVGGAATMAHESLRISTTGGLDMVTLPTLECLARILTAAGRHTEASRLLGACAAFRAARSIVAYPCIQRLLDEAAASNRSELGDEADELARADGATLGIYGAGEYARRLRVSQRRSTVGWDSLTPTEARVAELAAEGLTNAQIATELVMGAETVKTHLSKVFNKLGVANRKELILAASRRAAEHHR